MRIKRYTLRTGGRTLASGNLRDIADAIRRSPAFAALSAAQVAAFEEAAAGRGSSREVGDEDAGAMAAALAGTALEVEEWETGHDWA